MRAYRRAGADCFGSTPFPRRAHPPGSGQPASSPSDTAVAGADVACGGCYAYNDQPSATVEQGLALATVPNGVCRSRQGPGVVRAGTAPATPCGFTGPDGLVFL